MGLFDSLGKLAGQLAQTAAVTLGSEENRSRMTAAVAQQFLPELQSAIAAVSPVPIDVQETLAEQAVVIRELALNEAIARHLEQEGIEVASATVTLLDDDHLRLDVRPRVLSATLPAVSVPLRLTDFVVNQVEGFIAFEVVGPAAVAANGWFEQLVAVLVRTLMAHIVKPEWLKRVAPSAVTIDGSRIRVELKEGALKPLYTTTVSTALGRPVPMLGEWSLIDLFQVKGAHIRSGRLIIDFGLKSVPSESTSGS